MLIKAGISNKVDDTGVTVGKRYARTDECGIPFAITVDFDTLKDETVTLRDLDSMKQIRLPIKEVARVVNSLVIGTQKWSVQVDKYGFLSIISCSSSLFFSAMFSAIRSFKNSLSFLYLFNLS